MGGGGHFNRRVNVESKAKSPLGVADFPTPRKDNLDDNVGMKMLNIRKDNIINKRKASTTQTNTPTTKTITTKQTATVTPTQQIQQKKETPQNINKPKKDINILDIIKESSKGLSGVGLAMQGKQYVDNEELANLQNEDRAEERAARERLANIAANADIRKARIVSNAQQQVVKNQYSPLSFLE